uniref:Uncharacterized protein n=1 Tax=Arundo donax TaxID=35708 RepID=A0A0A9G9R4_ARUDO
MAEGRCCKAQERICKGGKEICKHSASKCGWLAWVLLGSNAT